MFIRKIITYAIPLLWAVGACASTLFDELAYTYETSPALGMQRAYLRAADERVGQAKAGWRPTIGVEGNVGHIEQKYKNYPNTPDFDFGNTNYDAGIVVSQQVFSGFQTTSSIDYAKTIVSQERAKMQATEQDVLLSAAIAYADVIRDRALLELQVNQEQVLARHLKSYQKRFKVGDLTRTDVAQAEARLSGAQTARTVAEGNLESSMAVYESVVGHKPEDISKIDQLDDLLPKDFEAAVDLMYEKNPSLQAAEYAKEAAQYQVTQQESVLLPKVDVSAGAGYQWGQPIPVMNDKYDGQYWKVGARLSVPLYQGGGEYARVREAKQLANQAEIALDQTRRQLLQGITQAWGLWRSSKASIDSIKAQIKASKMALDGVIKEANVGSRTVLDVLDAEQEYLNYRVSLVTAERDEMVAALNLLSSTGQMTATGLGLNVDVYDPKTHYDEVNNKWIGL